MITERIALQSKSHSTNGGRRAVGTFALGVVYSFLSHTFVGILPLLVQPILRSMHMHEYFTHSRFIWVGGYHEQQARVLWDIYINNQIIPLADSTRERSSSHVNVDHQVSRQGSSHGPRAVVGHRLCLIRPDPSYQEHPSETKAPSRMHHLFEIDELVREITRHMFAWHPPQRFVLDWALTCKTISDPVLDVLWETQDSLINLLKTLPSDIWEMNRRKLVSHFHLSKLM